MASKVADALLSQLFDNNLPQFVPNGLYSRLGEIWPLALVDLEAAMQGTRLEPDAIHPINDMILHMDHATLGHKVRDNSVYMITGKVVLDN